MCIRDRARAGEISTLVIVENDLTRHLSPADVAELVAAVPDIVVIDHTATPPCQQASLVLPVAAFSECSGTLVSQEGRAQRFFQAVFPPAPIQAGGRGIQALARSLDPPAPHMTGLTGWQDLDDVLAALAPVFPHLAPATQAAPGADYRMDGQKLRSQTYRASGRTVIRSYISVRDQPPPSSPDTPFSSSMEGAYGPDMPAALVSGYQASPWNSVQALNRFQHEIGGPLRGGDCGIRLLPGTGHSEAKPAYATNIPRPHAVQADTVLVLPDTRLFLSLIHISEPTRP